MGLVEGGKITLKKSAERIGVSYRQARHIRKAVELKGANGVFLGNGGQPTPNRASETLREPMSGLFPETYRKFNDTPFTKRLPFSYEKIEIDEVDHPGES